MSCDGVDVVAHVANSGRLRELLTPANPMYLAPARNADRRKTSHDLVLVEVDGTLVSADSRVPNRLVKDAIEGGALSAFGACTVVRAEVQFGESRLDLLLKCPDGDCFVEVKSVTLVENRIGLFPDAPTLRGAKHLRSLTRAVRQGHRAAVVFVVQRPDVVAFALNEIADPAFGDALRQASEAGVEVHAYRCRVSFQEIAIAGPLPVRLD